MKLEEALVELREGKNIERYEWTNFTKNMAFHGEYFLNLKDILSDDWGVIEEPGKTFCQVFEDYKKGKKIRRKHWMKEQYTIADGMNKGIYDPYYTSIASRDLLADDWEIV